MKKKNSHGTPVGYPPPAAVVSRKIFNLFAMQHLRGIPRLPPFAFFIISGFPINLNGNSVLVLPKINGYAVFVLQGPARYQS
ncbi:hypothetical protein O9H85_16765 [Paenibacillus filicis]|uniref:Uncharacterized protein n=1 Tax=Paenibacillus gyeongsangnamensis TaxID=3388067 RepID=A0ABT4QBI5_9BACL|nr:hypothetical protein [Paenibacillus filicis]MCZ8514045.1 hypothetical protein [Paenibacillus filicis]